MTNAPVLILAIGMTMVILVAEIDISVGSQFAVCSLAAAWLAKAGIPMLLLVPCALVIGAGVGAINGVLVARLRLPSIIVTWHAGCVAQRIAVDYRGCVGAGPAGKFSVVRPEPARGESLIFHCGPGGVFVFAWGLRNVGAGRAVYAVGSDPEAARLAGMNPARVIFSVFVLMGVLTALAAV